MDQNPVKKISPSSRSWRTVQTSCKLRSRSYHSAVQSRSSEAPSSLPGQFHFVWFLGELRRSFCTDGTMRPPNILKKPSRKLIGQWTPISFQLIYINCSKDKLLNIHRIWRSENEDYIFFTIISLPFCVSAKVSMLIGLKNNGILSPINLVSFASTQNGE